MEALTRPTSKHQLLAGAAAMALAVLIGPASALVQVITITTATATTTATTSATRSATLDGVNDTDMGPVDTVPFEVASTVADGGVPALGLASGGSILDPTTGLYFFTNS